MQCIDNVMRKLFPTWHLSRLYVVTFFINDLFIFKFLDKLSELFFNQVNLFY